MLDRAKKLLPPLLAILALLLMLGWMAGLFREKTPPGLAPRPEAVEAQTVPVRLTELTLIEPVSASVEAKQATLISSRVLARITRIDVRAGDTVARGQLLLQLEKSDLLARVEQSREQTRAITARLREARLNLQRVTELHARKLVAAAELDRASANKDALEAELAGARQALQEAEAALSFTEIRSPIDGRVVDRFAEPGDTAAPGVRLLELYNPLSVRIAAQVREGLALTLALGQPVTVEIPSLQRTLGGEIEELVPAADPGSRSFLVKAHIPYEPELLPGMYARLLLPAGTERQLLIPADRVVQAGQLDLVWVLEDGRPSRRLVRTGQPAAGDQITIIGGLSEGELVLQPPGATPTADTRDH